MVEDKDTILAALEKVRTKVAKAPGVKEGYDAWLTLIRGLLTVDVKAALEWNIELRNACKAAAEKYNTVAMGEMVKKTYLLAAPYRFDDFCIYIEWNRQPHTRFYLPRRKQLLPVVEALQRLEDDELDVLGISLPPGVGKSTVAQFYLSWQAGRHPDYGILTGSHSQQMLKGMYNEMLRIIDGEEYLWKDVFPNIKIVGTDADGLRIDLGKRKRFDTLQFSSLGAKKAGMYRAFNLLYLDDLVPDIETALSPDRMQKTWEQYRGDYLQRKQRMPERECKELHIATRWSVNDIIGRLEEQYAGDPRALFIRIPALDDNDESNFDYQYGVGFTTNFYRKQREIMDDNLWRALYMNEPIEREGQLYSPDELRRYFSLPAEEPDAIIAVCDTKDTGSDFCCMPVAYQYGQDYYIDYFICDDGKPSIIEDRIVDTLVSRKVKMCRFESNRAGYKFAENIEKKIKEKNGITQITTKWTQTNKETRIVVSAGYVKQHFLFRDESLYKFDKEYRTAMKFVCGYSMRGRNKHDDVVDGLSQLVDFCQSLTVNRASISRRWF